MATPTSQPAIETVSSVDRPGESACGPRGRRKDAPCWDGEGSWDAGRRRRRGKDERVQKGWSAARGFCGAQRERGRRTWWDLRERRERDGEKGGRDKEGPGVPRVTQLGMSE